MSACNVQSSATLDLYFYGELTAVERDAVERHLAGCADCRLALEELTVIRAALDAQPDRLGSSRRRLVGLHGAPAAGGDRRAPWAATIARPGRRVLAFRSRPRLVAALAMAALVTLVTLGVLVVVKDRPVSKHGPAATATPTAPTLVQPAASSDPATADPALAQASGQHFERSKLVVLGLATKDATASNAADWDYERNLATSLLNDTRLYRQAAESRGMNTLANVMRDLELVLLQTSMAEDPDAESLAQLAAAHSTARPDHQDGCRFDLWTLAMRIKAFSRFAFVGRRGFLALLPVSGAAWPDAAGPDSRRMSRAKDLIADEQWARAIDELRAAVADPKESNKAEALFWLAHSLNQENDFAAAVEAIRRLEREHASSPWVKPARSLLIELAQKLRRNDVLWWTAATPAPPPPGPERGGTPEARQAATTPRRQPLAASCGARARSPTRCATAAAGGAWFVEDWSPDTDQRILALGSLIHTDAEKVIPMLKRIALEDENPGAARRAVFVLAQSRKPQALSSVVEVATTGPEPVKVAAVRGLGRFGGAGGVHGAASGLFDGQPAREETGRDDARRARGDAGPAAHRAVRG